MAKLRLAFAKIVTRHAPPDMDLLEFVERALRDARMYAPGRRGNTIIAFLDIERRVVGSAHYLLAALGYAQGDHYPTIDPDTRTVQEANYPVPPFRGRARFLIDERGYVIIESMTSPAIQPEKVVDAIEAELRRFSNIEFSTSIEFLGLEENYESIVQFIMSLSSLREIEFTDLRHSNPSERSKYMDEAADQRVDTINHKSSDPNGIKRDHPEFQNELEHAKRYATISKAGGVTPEGYESMEMVQDELILTVQVESRDADHVVDRMVAVFHRVFQRLRRLD